MSDDKYQFCVGDIVIEKDFITIGADTQMKGIVIAIKHLSYNLGKKMVNNFRNDNRKVSYCPADTLTHAQLQHR